MFKYKVYIVQDYTAMLSKDKSAKKEIGTIESLNGFAYFIQDGNGLNNHIKKCLADFKNQPEEEIRFPYLRLEVNFPIEIWVDFGSHTEFILIEYFGAEET